MREKTLRHSVRSLIELSRGATLFEFCLVLGLSLIIVAATLEISRYMAIRGVVQQGAQRGLLLATRLDDIQYEKGDPNFGKFVAARRAVLEEAVQLPRSSFLADSASNAETRLMSFTLDDIATPEPADAILLRPGERFVSEDGRVYDHPTICSEKPPACTNGAAPRDPFATTESLMQDQRNPVVVVVRARVQPLFPVLPPFFPEGVAAGFRENFRKTLYNRPTAVPAVPPPPPQPSITPDPNVSPSPTPIASPTATPTATFFPCNCSAVQEAGCHQIHSCTICPAAVNQCICARDRTMCQTGGG